MAGVRSPTEAEDFPSTHCVQTGSGAHPASCTVGTGGSYPRVKRGRSVKLTTHPLLEPRLRKSRSYTSCHPNALLWSITGPLYLYLTVVKCLTEGRSFHEGIKEVKLNPLMVPEKIRLGRLRRIVSHSFSMLILLK
jgi:hypothetical protein